MLPPCRSDKDRLGLGAGRNCVGGLANAPYLSCGVDASVGRGGLCACAGIWRSCARAPDLILVLGPGRVGDEMVNRVIPNVSARPLGLSGAAGGGPGRQELCGSRPHVIRLNGAVRAPSGSRRGAERGVAELTQDVVRAPE